MEVGWGMFGPCERTRTRLSIVVALSCVVFTGRAAAGATRDLSSYADPVTPFTVTIAIDAPPGTIAAGVEDTPPFGWSVSNISDSGAWDTQALKVKWGPFFGSSIPAVVTYDATPSGSAGQQCFAGMVSFDGDEESIGGDACVGGAVPAASAWGLAALTLALLCAGTLLIRRGSNPVAFSRPPLEGPRR